MGSNKQRECYPEEQIIDWLFKRVSPEAAAALDKHVSQCSSCQSLVFEWSEILEDDSAIALDQIKNAEFAENALRVKQRLKDSIQLQRAQAQEILDEHREEQEFREISRITASTYGRSRFARYMVLVATACAGMFLFLLLKGFSENMEGNLFAGDHIRLEDQLDIVGEASSLVDLPEKWSDDLIWSQLWTSLDGGMREEWEQARLWYHPQTLYYQGVSGVQEEGNGEVWLNAETEELFIVLQNLSWSYEQDYQAWLMGDQRFINIGLLEHQNGLGHLYRKMKEIKGAEFIRVSIEPKGGSMYPTGPDFLILQLQSYE